MNDTNLLVESMRPVLSSFSQLAVRHFVGGSVASSFYGAVRSTLDVDLVCELADGQVTEFFCL